MVLVLILPCLSFFFPLFLLHLGRNRSYCDEGVIPFEWNRRVDPFGSRFLRSYDEAQIYGLGTGVLEQVHAVSPVLAPCRSLIPPQNAPSARLITGECTG